MPQGGTRKRRLEAEEPRPIIYRRGKIAVAVMLHYYEQKVIENDGCCPHCGKQIMSLNEQAEYEFSVTRETVISHADQKCAHHKRAESVDQSVEISGGVACSDVSGDDSAEDQEEEVEEDSDGEMCNGEDNWETSMLNNPDPIQANGSRQTGLMVRNNLGERIHAGGKTLAELLHGLLARDRPAHALQEMLEVAREFSNSKLVPNSFHVLKKALHMRSLASVDIHLCGECWKYGWKPLAKEKWSLCPSECTCEVCTCPVCLRNGRISKRFKKNLAGRFEPQQNCYYFGLEHQINAMYSIKGFRNSRKSGKTFEKAGSWWSSEHVRWINGQTGGLATPENNLPIEEGLGEAFRDENGVYSLHFDWVQVNRIGKKSYSVGMIVLRCDDVEESKLNTDEWSMPLMVIPGPKEPRCMDIHWEIIQSQFHEYSTGIKDLTIRYTDEEGRHEYTHKPFLVRACCDAIARHKLLHCRGASAKLVCPWCWTTSSSEQKSKIFGYTSPVTSPVYDWGDLMSKGKGSKPIREMQIQVGVTPPHLYKVTLDEHRKRSDIVDFLHAENLYPKEHVSEVCKRLGLSGKCRISWKLKTLHPLEFVHLPLYHILFLGLVKDFLSHVFRTDVTKVELHEAIVPNSAGVKQFGRERERILLNCDMNDSCIDFQNMSGWLISSLIAFVEVYSCFLFNEKVMGTPILSEVGKKAWGHLRHAVMYFLRDPEETMSPEDWRHGSGKRRRDAARTNLVEYAKICEEYMPSLCVQNLHISICRLFHQEEYSGRPNICHDLFTERVVRHLKKFSYRRNHEKSFVYRQLLREGRLELEREYLMGGDDCSDTVSSSDVIGRYDISTGGTYLLGSGKECSPSDGVFQRTEVDCMSLDFDENTDPCSNHPMQIYAHSELCLKHPDRFETIKSLQCLKEEKKNSKVVLVLFEREERLALVTTFSRMVRGNKTLARFAHCHIFKYLAPDNDPCTGLVYRYRHSGRLSTAPSWAGEHCEEDFDEMDVILPVESIVGKVVQFISPISYSDNGGKAYHIVYCARSRSRSGQRRQATTMSWLDQ